MPPSVAVRPRLAGGVAAGLLTLAACGASDGDGSPAAQAPATFATNDSTAELAIEPPAADAGPAAADGAGDAAGAVQPAVLGGRAFAEAVAPESEIETNLLPDLVVDDVGRGTKANFRNIFPADRPVLLWLWAPH